jgi:hypothetical protein
MQRTETRKMKTNIFFLLAFSMAASLGAYGAERNFGGLAKGAVTKSPQVATREFKPTREAGPWADKDPKRKTTVVVLAFGDLQAGSEPFAAKVAESLPNILSKAPATQVVSRQSLENLLKEAKLPAHPKRDDRIKVVNHALSNYDVAVCFGFNEGWLQFVVYRALDKTQAASHGFSVYFGDNPSEAEAKDAVDQKLLMNSIQAVLDKKPAEPSTKDAVKK